MRMDDGVVEASVRGVRDTLPPGDLVASLGRVADTARQLFDADGAGVLLLDDEQALAAVPTDDEGAHRLESAQRELGHGPCVDCLVLDSSVRTEDVQTDERWPGLGARMEGSGVHAVLGVPIRIAGGAVGSLNVYRRSTGTWDDSEVTAIRAFAGVVEDMVGAALLARSKEELAQQLQHALDHRKLIERAIGFVMAREQLDAVTAFDRLRRRARDERRKVADLAAELLGQDPVA